MLCFGLKTLGAEFDLTAKILTIFLQKYICEISLQISIL